MNVSTNSAQSNHSQSDHSQPNHQPRQQASTTPAPIGQMRADQLSERMAVLVAPLQLIDVRELEEVSIAAIDGFTIWPLSTFAEWSGAFLTEFDPHTETIVMCHHGVRSAYFCQWLQHQGFTNVKNLVGGIDAYSIAVDRNLRRY